MPGPTIFGREPAFYIGLIEAVLALVLSYNAFGLDQEQGAAIVAVVAAVLALYTAYVTRRTLLAVGIGAAKAVLVLFVAFGLHFTENQTAAIIALVTLVLGAFNMTQTDPLPRGQHSFSLQE